MTDDSPSAAPTTADGSVPPAARLDRARGPRVAWLLPLFVLALVAPGAHRQAAARCRNAR